MSGNRTATPVGQVSGLPSAVHPPLIVPASPAESGPILSQVRTMRYARNPQRVAAVLHLRGEPHLRGRISPDLRDQRKALAGGTCDASHPLPGVDQRHAAERLSSQILSLRLARDTALERRPGRTPMAPMKSFKKPHNDAGQLVFRKRCLSPQVSRWDRPSRQRAT